MQKIYTFAFLVLSLSAGFTAYAQVGINTVTPDASSALDIVSDSKGVLVPRLTLTQRDNIAAPANGLLIYQTDGTPGFYYYNSSVWQQLGGGGTGAFVDLSTNQTIDGTKTFNSDILVNGHTVGTGNGAVATNFAAGNAALSVNTSGFNNTATGNLALSSNMSGIFNTANGSSALSSNISGHANTALGGESLFNNATGETNTAIGYRSLYRNISGNLNTATGYQSMEQYGGNAK